MLVGMITTIVGLLMVSNLRYYSPKGINLSGRVPFTYMLVVVMMFVVIFIYPPGILFAMSLVYGLSGPILALRKKQVTTTAED